MIRTVIFDIGKVLVGYDWNEYFMSLFNRDEAFCARLSRAMFNYGVWEEADRGVWTDQELLNGFFRADPEIREHIQLTWDRVGEVLWQYDFTKDWIRSLQSRGYQVLYLSNWSSHLLEAARGKMDFLSLMDGGVFSFEEKLLKPDRAIYQCIADRYGLRPSECVFLDDRQENIDAAIDFGFHGIVVKSHDEAAAELEALLKND